MTEQELVKQWLQPGAIVPVDANTTRILITALRERLAQPEQQHSEQWWKHEVSNAWAEGYEKGRASVKQPEQEPVATLFGSLPVYDVPPAKPVAWVENLENARPHCVTDLKYCSVAQHERGEHLKYIPLYPAPPQREWQGLTDKEREEIAVIAGYDPLRMTVYEYRVAIQIATEAKLKEKNT